MLTPLIEKKYRLLFSVLDHDKNGYVDIEDFIKIADNAIRERDLEVEGTLAKRLKEITLDIWNDLYAYVDQNGDDKTTIDEWLQYVDDEVIHYKGDFSEHKLLKLTEQLFLLFDEDKDNYISLDEFINFFVAMKLEAGSSAKSFLALDKNSDHQISRYELIDGLVEFLTSEDPEAKGNVLFGWLGD